VGGGETETAKKQNSRENETAARNWGGKKETGRGRIKRKTTRQAIICVGSSPLGGQPQKKKNKGEHLRAVGEDKKTLSRNSVDEE